MACSKCGKVLDVTGRATFSSLECPFCTTIQKVPAILGSFLLAEQLGTGGMGAVYRAVDQSLGRFVAIKVMKQQLGADNELLESFLREARAAAALNHPNIVQIYSCGQEKGQPYIVMELVAGGRLDQMMENGTKVDEVRLLQIALDVAEGLKAADSIHLVHGDIKPANILFDKAGTAKVVDFGLAQFVNRQQEQGGIWGTPYYISPERARGGKADHRSDIYSLGATMFHALAGIPPFDGNTATDVVVARLKGPPPNLRDLEPTVSVQTAKLVERMMAADPVLRYPTSASLLADLRNALSAAKLARTPAGRPKKKQKLEVGHIIVMSLAFLFMVAAGAMVIHWFKQTPPPAPPDPVTAGPARSLAAAVTSTNVVVATPEVDPETVIVPMEEDGLTKSTVNFFDAGAEAELAKILSGLTNRAPGEVRADLQRFAKNLPAASARLGWLRVLQAIPSWMTGDSAQAESTLTLVASAASPTNQLPDNPVAMPQTLARHLGGELDGEAFAAARAGWPAWYGEFTIGLQGFRNLAGGDLASASAYLVQYLGGQHAAPPWAAAVRPAAQLWLDKLAEWEKERQRLAALVDAGLVAEARQSAAESRGKNPAFTTSIWDVVEAKVQELEKAREGQRLAELEAQRQVLVRQELDRLTAFMATNTQYTGAAKDYRKVTPPLLKLGGDMRQPEARERVAVLRDHLDRMEGLKTLLSREMESNPYKGSGWEAVGANTYNGVKISRARLTKWYPWDQVSAKSIAQLVCYYADSQEDAKKADTYLSLALFASYNGMPAEEIARYRDLAKAPGGDAEKAVERLMLPLAE